MQIKLKLLPLALLALSPNLLAQQIPGAGTQLRQIAPPVPPPRVEPRIRIEEASDSPAVPGAASVMVSVDELRFSGASVYSTSELAGIARFTPGSRLTLADVQSMAARITQHYRANGYFVARAYLPAQDITGKAVTIAVLEGRYGEVSLRNQTNLSDGLVHDVIGEVRSGDPIRLGPLEQRLLLLSDIPGVVITSTLVPGTAPGSSDLIVDVAPGRRVTGLVEADNAGNYYTGEYRLGATVNFNNLLGRGDVATVRVLSSGEGLSYGRASYQMQFGRATAGVAYSHLGYELGKQFEALGAHGTADIASIFGSAALIRTRNGNLYAGLAYENRELVDEIDLIPSAGREATVHALSASLYGNHNDGFGGGGANAFFLSATAGSLDIHTPGALAVDAATARSNGSYGKLWFNASRLQRLTDRLSLNASLSAQLASKNLDASEKFVLGGMDGIRAFPQGEAFGDEGYLLNLEARYLLATMSGRVPGQLHLLGFVDVGKVTVNKDPWFAGPNGRSLSGTGAGLTWNDPGNFAVRMYYATKLGDDEATSAPDKSGRFWIQTVKYF
jgi:hemolysin activation/secretion protein